MSRHSSNQSHFSMVPKADIPRSKFKRDSNLHTTIDAGLLVPVFVDEVLPADTFIMKETMFGRLATPLKPVMDNMYLDTFWFFVPTRLLFANWPKLNGEQENPGDSTDFLIPTVEINNQPNGSLTDYFGLPTLIADTYEVSALPFRAYNLIYNEWFRDQNLQDSVPFTKDDGPDSLSDYTLLRRGKRHDYFTSCLPFPQKGPAVPLPLGDAAPVWGTPTVPGGAAPKPLLFNVPAGSGDYNIGLNIPTAATTSNINMTAPEAFYSNTKIGVVTSNNGVESGIYADLTDVTGATINALREAFQIQKLFERDARGGTRYTEILRSHFGVISPDARLQRPEYLGGSSTRINVTPVANTTGTTEAAQGDLAGTGTVALSGRGFTYSATEHGYIIGLASMRADLNYQQGLNKLWSRQSRFDFYWPALSHLGEQAVLNKEIYLSGNSEIDDAVFGYQERYAEYRYRPNQISGKFRSNDPQSLDIWHLAQDFADTPALNEDFIVENPPIERVIAVPTEPHLILDAYFDLDCVRPMPLYSVPGLIDHF